MGVSDTPCDPGRWDKRQVAIWMESHTVGYVAIHVIQRYVFPGLL